MARIRVMLVDDHYLVRVGLANVLGFEPDMEVCAQAESGDEALTLHRLHHPDVTVMDLRMAGTDGLAALAALRRECPAPQVLALVVEGETNAGIARKLGIAGSTVKNHISSIFEKLGVTQRTEAVAVAVRRGIARIE